MKLVVTAAARRDLAEAFHFAAEHNPDAAAAQQARIRTAADRLTRFPALGAPLPDGRRRFHVPGTEFRLIYRQRDDSIVILRVWHAARQWPPA